MHRSSCSLLFALLATTLTTLSPGQTTIDNFSANANWAAPTLDGVAQFTLSGGRANYTTPNAAGGSDNSAALRWLPATLPYTTDWEVQVDVHARAASGTVPFNYFYGELTVVRTGDPFGDFNNQDAPLYHSLSAQIIRPGETRNAFQTGYTLAGNSVFEFPANGLGFPSSSTDGALRIVFNSTRKTLTTYYDADGATGGYVWRGMTAIDVDGAQTWNMTAASSFTLLLSVFSGDDRLVDGDVYFDNLSVTRLPTFSLLPRSEAALAGASLTLSAAASGDGVTYQWNRNGAAIPAATAAALTLSNLQPEATGVYRVAATSSSVTAVSPAAIVGLTSTSKVIGNGREVGTDIVHANGNVFDQILLEGKAATVTADSAQSQILRMSFLDMNDDIVQVEFSGAGTVSLVLDGESGPMAPAKYNQPDVTYMKGHAGIVVTGANETSNLSVFSVGKGNAVNQALFIDGVSYDGMADIAFIAITSTDGKFGGLRTANASYFATKGITGLYAPGVDFGNRPLFIHDIDAHDTATPMLVIGAGTDTRITGGSLFQTNGQAVQVAGLTQLQFAAGSTSHDGLLAAKANQGRLEADGLDVTDAIVSGSN